MKGSIGTPTEMHHLKRANYIKCDCSRCRRSRFVPSAQCLYCEYYDIINPHKKKCARYVKCGKKKHTMSTGKGMTSKQKARLEYGKAWYEKQKRGEGK